MQRRASSFVVAAAAVFGAACAVRSLDVGANDQPLPAEAGASDVGGERDAAAAPTLLEIQASRCAAAEGAPDYFANAAELTERLRGVWLLCPQSENWSVPLDAIDFGLNRSDGTFVFLRIDAAHDALVATVDPNQSGRVEYRAPLGSFDDAGATDGGTEESVALDDTEPRNGISIALVRGGLPEYLFIPVFEKGARRLFLRELGSDPATGVFVPVD